MRARATAGHSVEPVAFANPHLADRGPKLNQPARDANHPERDLNQSVRDTGRNCHGYLHLGPDRDLLPDRQLGPDRLGDDIGRGDRDADRHAAIESRRHGHELDTSEDDDEGSSQHHSVAQPFHVIHSKPGHR